MHPGLGGMVEWCCEVSVGDPPRAGSCGLGGVQVCGLETCGTASGHYDTGLDTMMRGASEGYANRSKSPGSPPVCANPLCASTSRACSEPGDQNDLQARGRKQQRVCRCLAGQDRRECERGSWKKADAVQCVWALEQFQNVDQVGELCFARCDFGENVGHCVANVIALKDFTPSHLLDGGVSFDLD